MPVSPYTRDRLAEAAGASRTLSEALEKLGVDPKSATRNYLRERMRKLGVDTSHFRREGARWTKEVLAAAAAASTSVNGVLRHLGIEPVGGHHTNIARRIRGYGIDTSHFALPVPVAATMRDNRRRRSPAEILVSGATRRVPGERLKRAMKELGLAELCAMCGIGPVWQGEPLPLEVDHIDGSWHDNRIGNLRLLCPNCHATTDSYRGRAKRRRA
ncbi:HNH endonuclease signature motif containing protein [Streptomyces flavofungini]|uniref:HNH endonuclease signature motif containing protein n=1 Tax=Streptomyces flavofungini TaxID=68200 RepID=UPI0034DEA126